MLIRRITHRLENRRKFLQICAANALTLNYARNRSEIPVLAEIFENREYADFFPFYEKACIVDIGAHYGYFSLFAARNSGPGSRILAFEPFPKNFRQLRENVKACKADTISCFNTAISDVSGKTSIFTGDSVNNSLIKDFSMLKKEQDATEIESKTLEEIMQEQKLDTIDFLKMDCEGSEYAIFETTPPGVFERITTLSLEFHDMKRPEYTAKFLMDKMMACGFIIAKHQYSKTTQGINYGKLIGTRLLKR